MSTEPACIALADERAEAIERARAHGLMIGGHAASDHGLSTLAAGIGLLEQAARQGCTPADIAANAAALERQAAALLGRLVRLRVDASATPDQRAA